MKIQQDSTKKWIIIDDQDQSLGEIKHVEADNYYIKFYEDEKMLYPASGFTNAIQVIQDYFRNKV